MTEQHVRGSVALQTPALIALTVAFLGFVLQLYFGKVVGQPTIGEIVVEQPGRTLGLIGLPLLAYSLWGRDWISTPLKAMLAPLLGAVLGLMILSAPIMTVTKMEFNRPDGLTRLQNVVLIPGPARLGGKILISNSSVKTPSSQEQAAESGNLQKGEGWMSMQMEPYRGNSVLWLAVLAAPLLGLLTRQAQWRKTSRT